MAASSLKRQAAIVFIVISLLFLVACQKQPQPCKVTVPIRESAFEFSSPANVTRALAFNALLDAERDRDDLERLHLTTFYINDTLLLAKRVFIGIDSNALLADIASTPPGFRKDYLEALLVIARNTPPYELERQNYTRVILLSELIHFRKNQTLSLVDSLALLHEKESQYRTAGVDTAPAADTLAKADDAFKGERLDEAERLLADADLGLNRALAEHTRLKRVIGITTAFFVRYWKQVLAALALIAILSVPIVKRIRHYRLKKKLEHLALELQTTERLMRKAQVERFQDGSITEDTYNVRMDVYRKRVAEIKRTMPGLEAALKGETHKKTHPPREMQKDDIDKLLGQLK